MLKDKTRLPVYLESLVNNVFKVLPLYEEENVGVSIYIDSLLFEVYGLDKVVPIESSYEYLTILSTIESIKSEMEKEDSSKKVIRREVFKCINIIKNMSSKIEVGE